MIRSMKSHIRGNLSSSCDQSLIRFPACSAMRNICFLRLMMDQSNLGDAAEQASQHDPNFDLSQILQTLLTQNALEKVTQ